MTITVLLIDAQPTFRKGLRALLAEQTDLRVVGETGDGHRAVELAREHTPDLVVMDANISNGDSTEIVRNILASSPETKVLALANHGEKSLVEGILRAGATGFMLRESEPDELIAKIRSVEQGNIALSSAVEELVIEHYLDQLIVESPTGSTAIDANGILTTKLYRPRITPLTVPRPRLLAQFEGWQKRPFTLVAAPAGYGKSTLLCQWLEECEYPSAWLSLDEDDNDLHTFLTYVVSAVRTLFPQAMEQLLRLLKGPTLPPLHVLTNTMINELAHCPERIILALDDYHQIVNSDIHELMRELLRHPPQPLHLAVATRTDPAFDLLHLRAYQQMSELRAGALSFTRDETAAFLEQMMAQAIDAKIVDALTDRTEGWATGLRLITLSAHSSQGLAELVAILPGEQQTLDYLIAEALYHQPDDVQECLLKTSILDRFCAPLCEAVCASPGGDENSTRDGTAFIEWLISANLFTVSLDYAGEWYRYHHLFRDLLRNQLISTHSAEEIAALYTHASRWLANNNLIDDALRYALAADDVAYAVALVSQHRYELMNTEQWNRLDGWLTMLPAEIVDADPVLLTTRAYIYEYRGELAEVFADCVRAEALLPTLPSDSPAQTALTGEIAVLNGEYNLLVGDVDAILQNAAIALEFLPDNARHIWSYAIGAQVIAHQMAADIERSRKIINDVLDDRATLPAITEARMMLWFCLAYWMEGDLDGLQRAASRCLQLGERHQLPESYSFGRYFLGVCHYVRNEMDAATTYLTPLFDDPFTVRPVYWVHAGCALARIHHAQGREAEASMIAESMIAHTTETNDLAALALSGAFQVELALMQGNLLEAQGLHADAVYDAVPPIWLFYTPQLTPAKMLFAQETPASLAQALTMLEELDAHLRTIHRNSIRVDLLALRALILNAQGEQAAAFEALKISLALACPGGLIRNYLDFGQPMVKLLAHLKKQEMADGLSAHVSTILAAVAMTASSKPGQPSVNNEALTARELQIVRLLTTEMSTDEIASELVISIATVRTHCRNIYGKLGARSRFEAVSRARDMGLI